ncbi:MAG: hypothetical protein Q8R72_00445 [Hylemonella sp.]|nr:hypothetical protein [Hylemonella sp.]
MPYYIYRLKPFGQLEKLEEHAAFAPASAQAKVLRNGLDAGTRDKVKVIFAENELQAEDLLCQVREPGPPGEE